MCKSKALMVTSEANRKRASAGGDLRVERGEAPFEVEESDRVGRVGRSRRTAAIESSDPGKGFVLRSGLCCRGRREPGDVGGCEAASVLCWGERRFARRRV